MNKETLNKIIRNRKTIYPTQFSDKDIPKTVINEILEKNRGIRLAIAKIQVEEIERFERLHGVQMGGAITSQDLTVTLPSSPTVGTEMIIIDSTGDANTNKIVLGRGGSKIKGICACAELVTSRVGVRMMDLLSKDRLKNRLIYHLQLIKLYLPNQNLK